MKEGKMSDEDVKKRVGYTSDETRQKRLDKIKVKFMKKEETEVNEGIRDLDQEKGTKERKASLEKKRGMKLDDHPQYKKEEVENVEELYKGKHGQTEKQYQDSRSDAGKMISGDSKGSGANYSYKAKNTGSNPAGGSKKPQGQARMSSKDRTYLQYQKANMKKEEVTFSEAELEAIQAKVDGWDVEEGYQRNPEKGESEARKSETSGQKAERNVRGRLKTMDPDKAEAMKKQMRAVGLDV